MSATNQQPQSRDIIKTGLNLPVIGTVSLGAIAIIAGLYFLSRRKRRIELGV